MRDKFFAVTRKEIYDRYLNHGVAARLLTHRGACYVDKHLTSKSWVVDRHVELQTLVLCLTTNALANKVYAMAHVAYIVNALHLEHMSLVAGKVRVCLDSLRNLIEACSILKLNIYHATMDALAERYGH